MKPILEVGTYGTHITAIPSGGHGFSGTVPNDLRGVSGTYDECLESFLNWFDDLSGDDKRTHGPNLRNDVFVLALECR